MSHAEKPRGADRPVNEDFDPLDPDYLADPYPYFPRFRRESPVFYAPKIDFWVVGRYGDVQEMSFRGPKELWAEWTPAAAEAGGR